MEIDVSASVKPLELVIHLFEKPLVAMVIDFVLHRGQLGFPELVEKVLASGRASILDVRKKMGGRGHSSDAAT